MTDNLTARLSALLADLDDMLGNIQPAPEPDQPRQTLTAGSAA